MRDVWLALVVCCSVVAGPGAVAAEPRTGDLAALRAEALERVNETRTERGLNRLELGEDLNEAAQSHAADMLARKYYAHESPEGDTVKDRYVGQGGSRWKLVAENIARCRGCPSPPTVSRVRRLHEGWMNSPGHRANILKEGLDSFGFGVVAGENGVFAVQTFAGPGTPPGLAPDETPERLSPEEQARHAVSAINRARDRKGIAPLGHSEALDHVAGRLLAGGDPDQQMIARPDRLSSLLPDGHAVAWRGLKVVAAGCGGCGAFPTAADIRHFVEQWLNNPQYRKALLDPALSHLGFALRANGEGRKVAAAVGGNRRQAGLP